MLVNIVLLFFVYYRVIEEFENKKKPLIAELQTMVKKVNNKEETFENIESDLLDLGESFNDVLYEMWKKLMTIEMNLYEQCEVILPYTVILNHNNDTFVLELVVV